MALGGGKGGKDEDLPYRGRAEGGKEGQAHRKWK
jgi:hypothetical protein